MLTVTTEFPMTIADRVKQLRKQHGLTQADLEAKAGVSIATIQRVERGEALSAATIASLASAFGMPAAALTSASEAASIEPSSDDAYLPLTEITSGKRLVDFILGSSAIDFDYMEIDDEALGDLLGAFYKFCQPRQDSAMPSNPADRIRVDIEAGRLLRELKNKGLTVAGGVYDRTSHEVQDDEDGSMPMLLATWGETCLVLRIGTAGAIVDRADVYERMGKWTSTNDSRIIQVSRRINPKLTVPRRELCKKLEQQISCGRNIQSATIQTDSEFSQYVEEISKWAYYNSVLLKASFSTLELWKEYEDASLGMVLCNVANAFSESTALNSYRHSVDNQVEVLKKIRATLDLYIEAVEPSQNDSAAGGMS